MNKNKINSDTNEIKNLLIITFIILAISVGLYFLTDKTLNKKKEEEKTPAEISYSEILVGTMFSRPYNEYYVLAYKQDDENADSLDDLFTKYDEKDEALKIYYIDLGNPFNASALSDTANKKPEKPEEVKIKDQALFLIKDGKVTKFYEKISDIEKALK